MPVLPQDVLLQEQVDGPVVRAVDAELGAREDSEPQLDPDLGRGVEAEEGLHEVPEIALAEGPGEAVREAEGGAVPRQPEGRRQAHDREVRLQGIELLVLGGERGSEKNGAEDQARPHRAARGPHRALGVTTIRPFIRPWPEPQYSEHLNS